MERLRTPFFLIAFFLIGVVFCLEVGSPYLQELQFLQKIFATSTNSLEQVLREQLAEQDLSETEMQDILADALANQEKPPGFGVPAMALLDGILLFTTGLMALSLVVPERIHVKYQGIATLLFSLTILGAGMIGIMVAMVSMAVMIALLLSFPFGSIFYLIKWGSFPRGQVTATLSIISLLRIGYCVFMVLAHQRFIQNRGLVLMVLTAMVGGIVVTCCHNMVPSILVSITDALSAVGVCILAVIWAIVLLIGAVLSVVKLGQIQ